MMILITKDSGMMIQNRKNVRNERLSAEAQTATADVSTVFLQILKVFFVDPAAEIGEVRKGANCFREAHRGQRCRENRIQMTKHDGVQLSRPAVRSTKLIQ